MNDKSVIGRIIPVGAEPRRLESVSAGERRPEPDGKDKRRTAGRFQDINNFVDHYLRGPGGAARAVWLILWRDARDGLARTSQADLARRAGCSARQVRRALKELVKARLLVLVHQGGLNRGLSVYRVVVPSPATAGARRKQGDPQREGH